MSKYASDRRKRGRSAWFPEISTGHYSLNAWYYLPSFVDRGSEESKAHLFLVFVGSYLLLSLTLIVSGILVAVRYSRKEKKFKLQKQNKKLNQQQKKSALATIVLMQLGFVVCLLPYGATECLIEFGNLQRPTSPPVGLVTTLFSSFNSLVNVIIYNARDEKFRKSAKQILRIIFKRKKSNSDNIQTQITSINAINFSMEDT